MNLKDEFPPGYLCVCGEVFKEPMERVIHSTGCQTWADHKLGIEILEKFPRDKYGGYMIGAPSLLVAFVRDSLKEKK